MGVPGIIRKRRLMEFFRVNWLELPKVPKADVAQARVVFEVEDELTARAAAAQALLAGED